MHPLHLLLADWVDSYSGSTNLLCLLNVEGEYDMSEDNIVEITEIDDIENGGLYCKADTDIEDDLWCAKC